MITWFQIGLTCGPVGEYLANEGDFLFYTCGDVADYQDFIAGWMFSGEI